MKIILRDDIASLGDAGEVVTVKDGYARNYLIPRGIAYQATKGNLKVWDDEKKKRLKRIARETSEAEKVKAAIETVNVRIEMQVGEEGRLFGSVTNRMIAEYMAEKGVELDHRNIVIDDPIRSQGTFRVHAQLGHAVVANIDVEVFGDTVVDEESSEAPVAEAAAEPDEAVAEAVVEATPDEEA